MHEKVLIGKVNVALLLFELLSVTKLFIWLFLSTRVILQTEDRHFR